MLLRQYVEAVTHFVKLLRLLQNLNRWHGILGLPGVLQEAGPAFAKTASPLLYTSF
jgi:hypothetical protein